jgi:MerR family transcriptional regulator, copper efflux regulator
MTRHFLTVGEAANAAGLSPKAVRLYEARGLLPEVPRTEAGYRTFGEDDVAVLRFIGQAKALGLGLAEIRRILEIRRGGSAPCVHVVELLDQHLAGIDRTIAELRQLRRALAETRTRAATTAVADRCVCGIIELTPHPPAATGRGARPRGGLPAEAR